MRVLHFVLKPFEPFRLDFTVWALKRRAKNILDSWDGGCYTRLFHIEKNLVEVKIEQKNDGLHITADGDETISNLKTKLIHLLEKIFGLKENLQPFYKLMATEKRLLPIINKYKGIKPPRFASFFEAVVNAITFQQLSLASGFSTLNRLIQRYGKKKGQNYAFPTPEKIAKLSSEDLMKLGFSRRKSETVILLASEISLHPEKFSNLDKLSSEDVVKYLSSFKGLGPWSAEYILLRYLGRIEILPKGDIALQRNLKKFLDISEGPEAVTEIQTKFYPFAGMLYFHFILDKVNLVKN